MHRHTQLHATATTTWWLAALDGWWQSWYLQGSIVAILLRMLRGMCHLPSWVPMGCIVECSCGAAISQQASCAPALTSLRTVHSGMLRGHKSGCCTTQLCIMDSYLHDTACPLLVAWMALRGWSSHPYVLPAPPQGWARPRHPLPLRLPLQQRQLRMTMTMAMTSTLSCCSKLPPGWRSTLPLRRRVGAGCFGGSCTAARAASPVQGQLTAAC
jgi:hypothetical protein